MGKTGATKIKQRRATGYDDPALSRLADALAGWGALGPTLLVSRSSEECKPEGPTDGGIAMNQAAGILARWGRVGSDLHSSRSDVDWLPAQRMVDEMQAWGEVQKGNYRDILDKSAACLAQFGEPLRVDFGTHRWLKNNREESYSAWLAWIIEQLESPGEVFGLFKLEGKDKNAVISDCVGIRPHVVCEKSIEVPSGEGRLDIVIEYRKTESEKVALIVIEVKLVSKDAADLQKQAGYRVWMDQQIAYDENKRFPVLPKSGAFGASRMPEKPLLTRI